MNLLETTLLSVAASVTVFRMIELMVRGPRQEGKKLAVIASYYEKKYSQKTFMRFFDSLLEGRRKKEVRRRGHLICREYEEKFLGSGSAALEQAMRVQGN